MSDFKGKGNRGVGRNDVRELVACRTCGASAGEPCIRKSGDPRSRNHETRRKLALRLARG